DERSDRTELLAHRPPLAIHLADHLEHHAPALQEERVEHLLLGGEVVVEQAIGNACLIGDVRHAAGVEALACEHPHGGVEDRAAAVWYGLGPRGAHPPAPRWLSVEDRLYSLGRRWESSGTRLRMSS